MTKVIITGAKGRMGQALLACAKNFPELEVVGAIDQGDDLGAVIARADVVIAILRGDRQGSRELQSDGRQDRKA